jgi:hypothetical protein
VKTGSLQEKLSLRWTLPRASRQTSCLGSSREDKDEQREAEHAQEEGCYSFPRGLTYTHVNELWGRSFHRHVSAIAHALVHSSLCNMLYSSMLHRCSLHAGALRSG